MNNIKNRNKLFKNFIRKIYKTKNGELSEIITPLFHNIITNLNWFYLIQINKKKLIFKKQLPSPKLSYYESFSDTNGCWHIKTLKLFLKKIHTPLSGKKNSNNFLRKEKEKNIYWITDNMTISQNIKNFFRYFQLKKKNSKNT